MAYKKRHCGLIEFGGIIAKRVIWLAFVLCLGVTGCVVLVGFYSLNMLPPNNPRVQLAAHRGNSEVRLGKNQLKDDTSYGNALQFGQGLNLSANIDTLIQGIAFNQTYKDTLVADIKRREDLRTTSWHLDETQYISDIQFSNYMKCPTSLRKKLLMEPFFRRKYIPEIPVLMWSKHYSEEEYTRLSQYFGIFGWKVARANVIASALSLLNTSSNTYMFDNDRLPGQNGCTSCAVIGNGGILNGSNMGKEIDAHDYVFRVNVALTEGHEQDVGTKTSFYCAAFRSLSNSLHSGKRFGFKAPPYQKGIRYVFSPKTEWAYMFLDAVLRGKQAPRNPVDNRTPPNFQTALSAKDIKLVHPDFERYLSFGWVNSSRKQATIYRPSTGAIMLLLALHTCDKVDVYGFAGSFEKYSEYYYDTSFRKHVSYLNHDYVAEKKLWIKLNQVGVINLYTRE